MEQEVSHSIRQTGQKKRYWAVFYSDDEVLSKELKVRTRVHEDFEIRNCGLHFLRNTPCSGDCDFNCEREWTVKTDKRASQEHLQNPKCPMII